MFSAALVLREEEHYEIPSVLRNYSANTTTIRPSTRKAKTAEADTDELFKEVSELISNHSYGDIVPLLSNSRKQKRLLSNPHLLSVMSILLNVKSMNLRGVAYELFLLYNSEIAEDMKGFPSKLLKMLLEVVYYFRDYANFDLILSHYLNTNDLDEQVLIDALKLYIDDLNIELAKQLFYQVVSYHSQNGKQVSPKIMEVFLERLIINDATFNHIQFGYNVWIQQNLPTTSTISDLMLEALVKSNEINKLNNFIVKLEKEDPKVLELNNFVNGKHSAGQFVEGLDKLKARFEGDLYHFYSKVIRTTDDVQVLADVVFPRLCKDLDNDLEMVFSITSKIAQRSDVEFLCKFMANERAIRRTFNHKYLRLLGECYVRNYPELGKSITSIYRESLRSHFGSSFQYGYFKEAEVVVHSENYEYKLIKKKNVKVRKIVKNVNALEVPISEKVQAMSNSLSRLGVAFEETAYHYLLQAFSRPAFNNQEEVQYVAEMLMKLSPEDRQVSTELAIVKKGVQLLFSDYTLDPVARFKLQKEIVLKFIAKNAAQLDRNTVADLSDVYMRIKDFDTSGKLLEQVRSLTRYDASVKTEEQHNYDALMLKRYEFKQEILSLNYMKVIELIVDFRKESHLHIRKFFIYALVRDYKFLQKVNQRMAQYVHQTDKDKKEALVISKLCTYLSNFIDDLFELEAQQSRQILEHFRTKLSEFEDFCK